MATDPVHSTPYETPPDERLRELLRSARRIAIVGMSPRAHRPSHYVAEYLQRQGYAIVPVNPLHAGEHLLGHACIGTLDAVTDAVDIVAVFRRTAEVGPVADAAIALGARCLWQQVGVVNAAAATRAQEAGLVSVMDRCLMVEHRRLLG